MLLSVVIKWEAIAIAFGVIILLGAVTGTLLRLLYNQFITLFNRTEFDKALDKGLKIEKVFIPSLMKQTLKLHIALLYLWKNDLPKFNDKLDEINKESVLAAKYYWATFSKFIDGNLEAAKQQYALFKEAPRNIYHGFLSYEFYDKCLSGVFDYYSENYAAAKEKIQEILPMIKNPLSKEFYEKILQKCIDNS